MELGSIFLLLALLILVGSYIGKPFLERRPADAPAHPEVSPMDRQADQERSSLLAERDRLLNAIQELDFDYVMGKIPEEDYPGQRALLLGMGVEVLKKLDASQAQVASEDVEARLEAAIQQRRAALAPQMAAPVLAGVGIAEADDALETQIANRRRARAGKAAGFCPRCGGPLQKVDRFCPKCGEKVSV
jgi:hypothetical protein